MKIRKNKNDIKFKTLFTNREDAKKFFWDNYQLCKSTPEDIHVIQFSGIGGIGKSALLNNLINEMQTAPKRIKFAYFDFSIKQDTHSFLVFIKNQLSNKYGFSFPLFELGLYIYYKKIGIDIEYLKETSFLDNSPLLSFMLEVMGNIPIINIVSSILKATDKGVTHLKKIVRENRYELTKLELKSPADIYSYLFQLFAKDLSNCLKNSSEPLVVILDSYEILVNEMQSVGDSSVNDLWLRETNGLIQNIPNVFWVIAGREKLNWEYYNSAWKDSLKILVLRNLSYKDSVDYLISVSSLT